MTIHRCELCGEHLFGIPDPPFCDQACLLRWLVSTKRVRREVAMHYVRQRLMGRPAKLFYVL